MTEVISEINTVMNYFGMVDQCQNLGRSGYSGSMVLGGMALIETAIKDKLQSTTAIELFNNLEKIYFPSRSDNND